MPAFFMYGSVLHAELIFSRSSARSAFDKDKEFHNEQEKIQ